MTATVTPLDVLVVAGYVVAGIVAFDVLLVLLLLALSATPGQRRRRAVTVDHLTDGTDEVVNIEDAAGYRRHNDGRGATTRQRRGAA